ncbi:MAG: Tol-Pal system beta propeller repeat protein TolB [Syntrophales bacterium]|nr:Tol-Pal system beta propeller repeat protein TolB [Syntrophales bacterium]MCK9528745.1 Tol-Pal system beta propeller repeat protein TolB [Syntrophales bacterium]MDX9922964.1 Tol-Pal system beta propeller repeat protein TolB [Syntrophales bacterium]
MTLLAMAKPEGLDKKGKTMKVCRTIGAVLAILLLSVGVSAWGKVYIDIDSPAFQKFPIAVQDFTVLDGREDPGENALWFADHMGNALGLTGYFRVINRAAFLEDRATAGITAPEIRFGDWLSIGADFLVKGGFEFDGRRLSAEFRLFDVVRGSLITGKKYWGGLEDRTAMVMKFADEVILALTGLRGVFGTKIAFVAKQGDISELYTVNFDGSGLEKRTDYQALTLLPRWSPDGGKLSFVSYIGNNSDSYLLNLATKQRTVLTNFPGLNMPSDWSNDGKRILTVLSKDGHNNVYELDLTTKAVRQLTHGPAIDVSPSWSPDESEIVFVSNRSGAPQLFVMDADGKNVRRITFDGSYNTSPQWSPAGDTIVYVGAADGLFQLFTISARGGTPTQLTYGSEESLGPSWSPDGRYIVFTRRQGGTESICIINSNGLNFRFIGSVGGGVSAKNPSWSPFLDMY